MTERYLVIKQKQSIRFYKITKNQRPLTIVKNRIFRTDEKLMVPDNSGNFEMIAYDIDSTQPYNAFERFLDPDITKLYIDSMKLARNKPVNLDSSFDMIFKIVIGGIVGLVILWGVGQFILGMM